MVAVGIVAYMKYAPGPTAIATLDLSSVDLSFAEDEDETAAVSPTMPAAPEVEPLKPREEKPPEAEKAEDPLPPDPTAPKLVEPEPEREQMETPSIPPRNQSRRSRRWSILPRSQCPPWRPNRQRSTRRRSRARRFVPIIRRARGNAASRGTWFLKYASMPRELLTASTSFRPADFPSSTKRPFARRERRDSRPRSPAARLSPLPHA